MSSGEPGDGEVLKGADNSKKTVLVFLGASAVGKTTLIQELLPIFNEASDSNDVPFAGTVESVSRRIGENKEAEINQNVLGGTQLEITFGNAAQIINHPCQFVLTERFMVDNLAYSRAGKKVSKHVLEIHEKFVEYFYKNGSMLTIIPFYIPIEFYPKGDGVRNMDVLYQDYIDAQIRTILSDYGIQYYTITGSVEERVQMVKDNLRMFGIFL